MVQKISCCYSSWSPIRWIIFFSNIFPTTGILCCVFATRLATNIFHFLGESCSQVNVTVESGHTRTFAVGNRLSLKAFVAASTSIAPSRLAQSSNLGTQTDLIGAALVFAVSIFVLMKSSFSCLMKTTAAYVVIETSQKTRNCKSDFLAGLRTFRWRLFF